MYRSSAKRLSAFIVSVGFFLAGTSALVAAQKSGQANGSPTVGVSTRRGQSAPLRDYRLQGPVQPVPSRQIRNELRLPKRVNEAATDPVVQNSFGTSQPSELLQFEGGSDDDNAAVWGGRVVPPDTNGDVGPSHYAQYINLIVTIYDKSGGVDAGPLPGNWFWDGFGGPCETRNDGDPVVKYDRMANRWVFTQFAVPNFPDGPSYQCFAVSKTGDPTGAYWLYEFTIGSLAAGWGDYPKLGVWPDAYYIAFNMFTASSFTGMGCYAFDRSAMLAGDPAGSISFQPFDGGGLPSDLDGSTPPPAGSPNYYMTFWNNSPGELYIYQFHVDWATPGDSTFTGPTSIPIADWTFPCGFAPCVPQLDSPELLDTLADRLMNRLAYRNFGTHESLVTNYTVGTAGGETAVRWFELRNPAGTAAPAGGGSPPFVYQQGTYAPDSNFRWMGSIAQDFKGNMALGYSISSSSMYPSIGITGRLVGDPLGTMGGENIFLSGTGSQVSSFNRWGDYSSMSVDPVDDCTFWYTQEYYANTANFDFKTRIASFKYPSCTNEPTGTIEGTVTDGTNPISGALVSADGATDTTDAAGHYSFLLPVGTYDMTATKFGYFPGAASGVEVTDGGTTTQDFTLAAAPSTLVNGTVRDAVTGWPLYARIGLSAPGYGGATLWNDPVSGYYGITLVEGVTYTFVISAVSQGYLPGGGPVPLGVPLANAPFLVQNWTLAPDAGTCNAPGYTSIIGTKIVEPFSGGQMPSGWSQTNFSGNGVWRFPTSADACGRTNMTGGTGGFAIIDSDCDGLVQDDVALNTPALDLSGAAAAVIEFNSDYDDLDSVADVDVSTNGGTNWTNVWQRAGADDLGPTLQSVDITALAAGEANVQARFHYQGFWAWWWEVDNVVFGDPAAPPPACVPGTGGLVVGNVTDANTGNGLNGASVENLGGDSTTTFPTPDPNQGDGFYILYAEAGPNDFEASSPLYQTGQESAVVVPGSTQRVDFSLLAGRLSAAPTSLSARVDPGQSANQTLTLTNTGSADAPFSILELDVPATTPSKPVFVDPKLLGEVRARLPRRDDFARDTKNTPRLPAVDLPDAPSAAGNVISSFPSNLGTGWGMAFNTDDDTLWISNPQDPANGLNGDGYEYQYQPDGTQTGATIDIHDTGGLWQADGAYNQRTGMLWHVNVGGDNCLFEMNPASMTVTGNTICGSWAAVSQRGLAYNVLDDTYYVGGWNEGVVYHVDGDGVVLDSAFVGLGISGMAFNPRTRHLFAMDAFSTTIYVLDAANGYTVLSFFKVNDNGTPVTLDGAGLSADCGGHLWVMDQGAQVVYEADSGESNWCVDDIPWLSENPTSGIVPGGANGATNPFPVATTFDSAGLLPGLRQGQLLLRTETPYSLPNIPVDFTVRFLDVPDSNQFQAYIYGAAGAGIMMGGPPNCPAGVLYFCPGGVVTRADMAGYIWRAVMGANTPPPVYQNIFTDVTFNQYNSFYIQGIFDLGITAGCQVNPPLYCPNNPNTRAQASVFIWKGQHGDEAPPPCTPPGIFADVPCPGGFAVDYIEGIYDEGVTVGCGGGNFCPNANISNGQMAVFLVKAFNVPYLP